jgi:hypothetical protein
MGRILLAASPEPRAILERILSGHELSCATTFVRAKQFLGERTFDLIICTIAFDDSMMFEFLQAAKSTPGWQGIPFVCARVRSSILRSPIALQAVQFTCAALGAATFLDIAQYRVNPELEMREAIDRLLDAPSRRDL